MLIFLAIHVATSIWKIGHEKSTLLCGFQRVTQHTSPKCGTLTWWGGLSGLIEY